jgi:pyrroloquinoline quinone biosynthesis protein B
MGRLRVLVIGSAAGGGFPQWNCGSAVSRLFWEGDGRVVARSQSSLAVSGDGKSWTLFNCSPDIRQQIMANRALWPELGTRDSPIASVLLTNGDIDHLGGLLTLRESHPFRLFGTRGVLSVLTENRIFDAVNPEFVPRIPVSLDETIELGGGVSAEIFAVPGKVPLYLEEGEPEIGAETETTVGVKVTGSAGEAFFYVPGCAHLSESLRERLSGAELLLFDGTLWRDDEMIQAGVGVKTGQRMGHISMSGPEGSLEAFKELGIRRKVFVHINNTNPVLIEGAPERLEAEAAGWEIGYDGMEITL